MIEAGSFYLKVPVDAEMKIADSRTGKYLRLKSLGLKQADLAGAFYIGRTRK